MPDSKTVLEAADRTTLHARYKWAQMIKARDEHGRRRVLALDWDGRWHDLSPGNPGPPPRTQRADLFNVGDLAMYDGAIWRRVKADVSIEYVAFTSDGENVLLVDADSELEVLR